MASSLRESRKSLFGAGAMAGSAGSKKSMGSNANFKVVLRIRPLSQKEKQSKEDVCLKPQSATVLAITKSKETFDKKSRETQHTFTYDRMYHDNEDQMTVFSSAVEPVVLSTLEGYNGSIIAYGQTGTGKTYTIEGDEDAAQQGIIPRAGACIFKHIESGGQQTDADASKTKYLVRVSMFQIYNEKISDLLVKPGKGRAAKQEQKQLGIREDSGGDPYVDGLSEHIVKSPKEIVDLLNLGKKSRATAATVMNQASSRSHAVFTVIIERSVTDSDTGEAEVTIAKLNLVDLAGSERVNTRGDIDLNASGRLDEAKNINSSLSTFGKVVMALTSRSDTHVPYRDSKLTRILQDSIGGNCKTTLITTVTPSASSYGETLNSLKFAYRAKDVKNDAKVNLDMTDQALLTTYQREIKRLQAELKRKNKEVHEISSVLNASQGFDKLQLENSKLMTENARTHKKLQDTEGESQRHRNEVSALQQRVKQMEQQLLSAPQKSRLRSTSRGSSNDSQESGINEVLLQLIQSDNSIPTGQLAALQNELESSQIERKKLEAARKQVEQEKFELQAEYEVVKEQVREGQERVRRSYLGGGTTSGLHGMAGTSSSPAFDPAAAGKRTRFIPPPPQASRPSFAPSGARPSLARGTSGPLHGAMSPESYMANGGTGGVIENRDGGESPLDRTQRLSRANGIKFAMSDGLEPEGVSESLRASPTDVFEEEPVNPVGHSTPELAQPPLQQRPYFDSDDGVDVERMPEARAAIDGAVDILGELGDPDNGITTFETVYNGKQYPAVFSGNDASVWFLSNVEGIDELDAADTLGQHLMDSGEIWRLDDEVDFDGGAQVLYALFTEDIGDDLGDEDDWDSDDILPLHSAAADGDQRALKEMLEYGTHADTLDGSSHTAIMHAAINKQHKAIDLLIKWGANTHLRDENGRSALVWAAYTAAPRCVKLLLAKDSSMLGVADNSGRTALHWSTRLPNVGCINALTQAAPPAVIDSQDKTGATALHWSVLYDRPRHCGRLLKCGSNASLKDDQGRTAAHYAVSDSRVECLERILKVASHLVGVTDDEGRTLLHLAANAEMSIECGVEILRYQADIDLNAADLKGATPLHWAAVSNNPEYCSLLVQYGALLEIRDTTGNTPYDYASARGYAGCAEALQRLLENPMANVTGAGTVEEPDGPRASFGLGGSAGQRRGSTWTNKKGSVQLRRTSQSGPPSIAQPVGGGRRESQACLIM